MCECVFLFFKRTECSLIFFDAIYYCAVSVHSLDGDFLRLRCHQVCSKSEIMSMRKFLLNLSEWWRNRCIEFTWNWKINLVHLHQISRRSLRAPAEVYKKKWLNPLLFSAYSCRWTRYSKKASIHHRIFVAETHFIVYLRIALDILFILFCVLIYYCFQWAIKCWL